MKQVCLEKVRKAHFLLLFIDRISMRNLFSFNCGVTNLMAHHCWRLDVHKVRLIISGIGSVPG
jgi:hypothetical protein